ncbi:hypothetical protein EDC04DRAFT_2996564 [Pisolithus marmoratus]|nr:hypothetical protein EDC04DRAFT_2996564 [Pisolithus marmoratus]
MDESQVVGGYGNGDIHQWKIEDGKQQGLTMQVNGSISCIAISQDRRWIISGDSGGKVTVWNAANHEKVREIIEDEHYVCAVDISSDCSKIASVDYYSARIFSIDSDDRLLPPLTHYGATGVRFSPDGSRFTTASYDQGLRLYSAQSGHILFDSGPQGSTNTSSFATPLAWPLDGQQLFVASISRITSFDVSEDSYSSAEWAIHEHRAETSIVSNSRFIACSAGSSVSLWGCMSHTQIGCIIPNTTMISCFALSPSGQYLACGSNERAVTIHNITHVLSPEYFVRGSPALPVPPVPLQPHPSQLPLVQVSDEALKSWTQGDLASTEMLLSAEITGTSSASHYLLANRALIRVHLEHWALAIEDAERSLKIQPSPIGHIAMAVALLGQGDREGALCTFDLAFHDCEVHEHRFLLLLKSILVFESGNQEEAITRVGYLVLRANNDSDDSTSYLYTQARASRDSDVLGIMYMRKGNYGSVIPLIERAKNLAPKDKQCPPLKTISLIFGWSFNALAIVAQKAVEILLNVVRTLDEEIQASEEIADWIEDFKAKCTATLESVGDEAVRSERHNDAIIQYSTALSLSPPSPAGLFIKRSEARAAQGLWEDALQDANEAVRANPSYHWGYEAKYGALHGAKRYDEAIDAFKSMLDVIEQSDNREIRELRNNYISPSETVVAIDVIVRENLRSYPLVVINVTTGCLCDSSERVRIFKADPSFKELVSSMTSQLDNERILRVVGRFYAYTTFSHAWQGNEPLFQDVNAAQSVWNLPDTPLNEKLRNFCKKTRRLGYNWAWSDTCCIDKTASSILNQSLTSMYKWYADSAVTLVFLSGVAHPSEPGDLTRSLWMTRAWTLQELLAPKAIIFYDSTWEPYLGDTGTNHKELGKSNEIIMSTPFQRAPT